MRGVCLNHLRPVPGTYKIQVGGIFFTLELETGQDPAIACVPEDRTCVRSKTNGEKGRYLIKFSPIAPLRPTLLLGYN